MPILKSIISKINGSAGNLTFKQTGGQTIVSEKVTQTNDPKTELQVKQRMKWANVIRNYQVLRLYMNLAFGGFQHSRSDYNKFVSVPCTLVCVSWKTGHPKPPRHGWSLHTFPWTNQRW